MDKNALEIHNLTKTFAHFKLDHISFSLPHGYIMGLVGKNGAGKTTIIKLMLELLQKESGNIQIFGQETDHNYDFKQDIAVVFDEIYLVDDWKINDVEAALSPFYIRWNTDTYHQLLKKFNLSETQKVKELSKGMKIKLMLAIALSHEAKLLILDEPTSGLDPVARDELLDILLEYIADENHSVLFSTHITTDLDKIADYLTIMNDGQIFYTGSKDYLFEKYCLVKGDSSTITNDFKAHAIGIHQNSVGFSALLHIEDMKYVAKDMSVEQPTIDEILIHIDHKGG